MLGALLRNAEQLFSPDCATLNLKFWGMVGIDRPAAIMAMLVLFLPPLETYGLFVWAMRLLDGGAFLGACITFWKRGDVGIFSGLRIEGLRTIKHQYFVKVLKLILRYIGVFRGL